MKEIRLIIVTALTLFTLSAQGQHYTKATWWNTAPERYQFFVGPEVALPESGFKNPAFGLRIGVVKTLGFYAQFVTNGSSDAEYAENGYGNSRTVGFMTNDYEHKFTAYTGGVMLRLGSPIYLHVGAGLAKSTIAYKNEDGEKFYTDGYGSNKNGSNTFVIEAGLSLKINRVMLTGNYMFLNDIGAVTASIAYCF